MFENVSFLHSFSVTYFLRVLVSELKISQEREVSSIMPTINFTINKRQEFSWFTNWKILILVTLLAGINSTVRNEKKGI